MEYYSFYDSPIGKLLLTAETEYITGLWFADCVSVPVHAVMNASLPVFNQLRSWLDDYFDGKCPNIASLPLKPRGTPFQMLIWELLNEIPYGQSTTYGTLAKQAASILGKEAMSAQAVGNAVGKNPVSIVIPCHRILGKGGTLTGYAGGLDKKRFLLDLESIPYK